jgi:nitrogen fixation NifU-like protein
MQLDQMYQEIILDHYRHPHHRGLVEPYDAEAHHVKPDVRRRVTVRVRLGKDGSGAVTSTSVSHEGLGCSISQASTSVMAELVTGSSLERALAAHEEFRTLMQSRGDADVSTTSSASTTRWRSRGSLVPGPGSSARCSVWMAFQGDAASRAAGTEDWTMSDQQSRPSTSHRGPCATSSTPSCASSTSSTSARLRHHDRPAGHGGARHDADEPLPAHHRRHRGPDERPRSNGIVQGFTINWVWMPPWGPDKITDEGREAAPRARFNV